jgi:nucleoside-diphosphate-sugar epimerase
VARILVTGAAGFIGQSLCPVLATRGHRVVAGLRTAGPVIAGSEPHPIGDITPGTDWSRALAGIDIVIHLAQRAHRRAAAGPSEEPAAAAALALAAARAGVKRFVFMSSIKAMADATPPGRALRADHPPRPVDAYGRNKLATERALAAAIAGTGLELVTLRPPLVYGPGVGANFRALLRLTAGGLPLPFAAIDNRRSLLFIDNLVDLLAQAATHPAAAGQVLLAADNMDFSTPALIRLFAAALGRPARLFAVPGPFFAALRRLPGIGPPLSRLTLSLQVDGGATRALLGWAPPIAAEAGLAATARAFAGR